MIRKGWIHTRFQAHSDEPRAATEYNALRALMSGAVLKLDADALVTAMVSNVITTENASVLKASLAIKETNGPITFAADPILKECGDPVIPDILANTVDVIVSYFG